MWSHGCIADAGYGAVPTPWCIQISRSIAFALRVSKQYVHVEAARQHSQCHWHCLYRHSSSQYGWHKCLCHCRNIWSQKFALLALAVWPHICSESTTCSCSTCAYVHRLAHMDVTVTHGDAEARPSVVSLSISRCICTTRHINHTTPLPPSATPYLPVGKLVPSHVLQNTEVSHYG